MPKVSVGPINALKLFSNVGQSWELINDIVKSCFYADFTGAIVAPLNVKTTLNVKTAKREKKTITAKCEKVTLNVKKNYAKCEKRQVR